MKTKEKSETISVLVDLESKGSKAAIPRLADRVTSQVVEIDSSTISENLSSFISKIQPIITSSDIPDNSFSVDEIELSLVINASGGIELIGKLTIGAEAGIKVTLKRR